MKRGLSPRAAKPPTRTSDNLQNPPLAVSCCASRSLLASKGPMVKGGPMHTGLVRRSPGWRDLDRHSGDRAGRCCIRRGRLARGARSGPGLRDLPAPTPAGRRPVRLPADQGSRTPRSRSIRLPPPDGPTPVTSAASRPAPHPPSSPSLAAFFRRTAIAVDSVDPARNRGASIRAPRCERRGAGVAGQRPGVEGLPSAGAVRRPCLLTRSAGSPCTRGRSHNGSRHRLMSNWGIREGESNRCTD